MESILAHERALAKQFVDGVRQIGGITLYGGAPERGRRRCKPEYKGKSAVETAQILDQEYKIGGSERTALRAAGARNARHVKPRRHSALLVWALYDPLGGRPCAAGFK